LGADAIIRCIERLPDGKFLIGGEFTEYDGVTRSRLARLGEDGRLDTTFDPSDGFGTPEDYVDEIELLDDGKALAAGRFSEYGGHSTRNVVRILGNGNVDDSFTTPDNPGQYVEAMTVLSNGKILLGSSHGGQIIFRLEEDGSRDLDYDPDIFGSGVYGLLELADGRVMVSGEFESSVGDGYSRLIFLEDDGSVDEDGFQAAVNPDGWVGPLLKASDGSIYAGGRFSRINGEERGQLARFAAFSPDVHFSSAIGTITEGESRNFDVVVNSDSADGQNFRLTVEADDPAVLPQVQVQPGFHVPPGESTVRIYVYFQDDLAINAPREFRLRISPDSEGGGGVVGSPDVMTITVQDDDVAGTVFLEKATGVMNEGRGSFPVNVKRFADDPGSLSVRLRTVDGTALAGRDYQAVDTVVDFPVGVYEKTVNIGGPPDSPGENPLRRFTVELYDPAAGTLLGSPAVATVDVNDKDDPGSSMVDYTVPDPGTFFRFVDLALDPDGVLYGLAHYSLGSPSALESRIIRFSAGGDGQVFAVVPTGGQYRWANVIEFGLDGRLFVSGAGFVFRYLPDGSIDDSWTNPIDYDISSPTTLQCMLPMPDGKLMIAGRILDPIGGIIRNQVARLMPDGSLDESFDLGTILPVGSTQWIYDMALDNSGRILLAGNFSSIQGVSRTNVARIFPDGSLDESFDATAAIFNQGLTFYVNQIVVAPDGKVFLSGSGGIIRVNADGTLDPTFFKMTGNPIALQPDGKLLIGSGSSRRVDASGQTDGSFNIYSPPSSNAIELGPDGRVHYGGSFASFEGIPAPGIATVRGGSGSAAGKLVWETNQLSVGEGIGTRVTKLRRIDSSVGNVGVHYTLVAGTAGIGTDVEVFSGYHQFVPGETEHEIEFSVLNDTVSEGPESFRLVLHDTTGGVRTGDPRSLNVEIIDDDGSDITSWTSLHYPADPLDPTILDDDPDGDGVKTFVEWMTDTDPTQSADVKHPAPSWHQVMTGGGVENRFGISFYLNPSKTGFRTVVETSESLETDSWKILWDSKADPLMESDLIPGAPLEVPGWMSVRSPGSTLTKGFLRIRYEME
jgi:uncharacterized delta-60 repeat protein